MAELKPCPLNNHNCMCQFCIVPCDNGLNCSDCNHNGKAVHEVYLCTGFVGDVPEHIKLWRNKEYRRAGESDG